MKKTILLLNSERYFYPDALNAFLSRNASRISKIFVFPAFTDPVKKRAYETASMRIMGPKFVSRYLVRVAWRTVTAGPSIESVARRHGIPLAKITSVNSPELVGEIKKENYEVGLSMVSQIYAGEILSIPNFSLYNFHPSLLPRNKGKFPIFWAFLRQEKEQGVTCHEITKKIDDGRILFQKHFQMESGDNVATVLSRFVRDIPDYLEEALKRIDAGNFETPLTGLKSFYGPTPTKDDIRKYWEIIRK